MLISRALHVRECFVLARYRTQVYYLGRRSDFTKLELSERYSALHKNLKNWCHSSLSEL